MEEDRRIIHMVLARGSEIHAFPLTGELLLKDRGTSLTLHVGSLGKAVELYRAVKLVLDEMLLMFDEEASICIEEGSEECGKRFYRDGEITDKQGFDKCLEEMNKRCLGEAYGRRGLK